ncbi:MAG TPA: response regulator [Planctomycetota bacterium]|jgi:two-component system chemotaxis response regulator CheY|nr:response regulator [Planctomycetota bacterium]
MNEVPDVKSLVVDDEFVPRMLLQRVLQAYGPSDAATNLMEALAAVRHAIEQQNPYQLICLDIEMPGGSGQDVLKEIRRLEAELAVPEAHQTRVLMTSGHSEPEQVKASFHNGSDGFLVKPVDVERLKKRLREMALIPIES